MSDPQWRDVRPSRPYGGDPGDRPGRRDTRGTDPRRPGDPPDDAATRRMPAQTGLTQPIAPQPGATQPGAAQRGAAQPTFTPRPSETSRRPADRRGPPPGPGAGNRSPGSAGRLSRVWEGSLRGGLGVCVIVGSAMIGAIATIVTKSQPGSVLGLSVLAGTVAAALTVQPQTGRLIFPVPALSYLVAALGAGVVYDRSQDKTQIAVGAAQWIADGFFVMVLATLLAIALTTVRWFMWRRDQPGPAPPDWPDRGRTAPRPQPGPARPPGARPGTQPTQWRPGSQGTGGQDPRSRPYPEPGPGRGPDQRPRPQPGSGPYNFSSGA